MIGQKFRRIRQISPRERLDRGRSAGRSGMVDVIIPGPCVRFGATHGRCDVPRHAARADRLQDQAGNVQEQVLLA
ncbi:hypothetical protein [Pandoraea sp. CB10b_02]|uniref:hypothetical protein n=1 Tax=Pandoraea sp. CB10b_02 TaxID=2014535 RepID=UPI00258007C8|nr:hypothetical protein [Pandoraea sp. CB10b_02]